MKKQSAYIGSRNDVIVASDAPFINNTLINSGVLIANAW